MGKKDLIESPTLTLQQAVAKLEADLQYRLPQSNKPVSSIVLPRAMAELIYKALLTHLGDCLNPKNIDS